MTKHVLSLTFAIVIAAFANAWAGQNSGVELPEITISTLFPSSVIAGMKVNGEIAIQIPKGWHLYAPGKHKYIALSIKQGSGPVKDMKFTYPQGVMKDIVGEQVPLYEGEIKIKLEGQIAPKAPAGKTSWNPEITWQSCTDTICLAPETGALAIEFTVEAVKK
jgi:hypothetical protein